MPLYAAEILPQMVELARSDETPARLSHEFGRDRADRCQPGGACHRGGRHRQSVALIVAEREELARLRGQLRPLQMDRDIP